MLLKGMVESSLLFKDELLTPDIDGLWHFEFLEGELKTRKLTKLGRLDSGIYFSWCKKEEICSNLFTPELWKC